MIPCTGTIKASDINIELGRTPQSIFKIGNTEERALAGKPNGLIKFSDFYCKSSADPLPWLLYAVQQTGGRAVATDPSLFAAIDGRTSGFWGGTNGWLKFNNHFTGTVSRIQVTCKYNGREGGYHTIKLYERSNPDSSKNLANNTSIQTFWLYVNVPAGTEIWLNWSGSGDSGDCNTVDYVAITAVEY